MAGKQTLAMWVCRWFKEEGNIDRNDEVAYKVRSHIKKVSSGTNGYFISGFYCIVEVSILKE